MLRAAKFLLANAVALMLLAGSASAPAWAEPAEGSRGVKIIDAPTSSPEATPSPAVPPGPASQPGAETPTLFPSPAPGVPSALNTPAPALPGNLATLPVPVKVANAADLSIEILPGPHIPVGTRVSFRVSAKKEGYLLLVDVDVTGKLTQIYPNPMSLMSAAGDRQNSNRIKPGKPVLIPNPTDIFAGFEFIASPPQGTAMVLALLSDKPVQMVDLPDLPANLLGQPEATTYLSNMTRELRIPAGDSGGLQEARWSLDAKFYAVQ
jgi:hypothetical protein